MSSKYLVEIMTDDFSNSPENAYYAKLFSTKSHIDGDNFYNDCQIHFRAFQISSTSGISEPKYYTFTAVRDSGGNDIFNLIDYTPHETNLTIGYNSDSEGNVMIYGKPVVPGVKIKIQVLYASTIGMFDFKNGEKFNHNITVVPSTPRLKSSKLELWNGWITNDLYNSYYRSYQGVTYLNISIKSGTISPSTVIARDLPIPKDHVFIPAVNEDGKPCLFEVTVGGNFRVVYVPDNTKYINCYVSYLNKF